MRSLLVVHPQGRIGLVAAVVVCGAACGSTSKSTGSTGPAGETTDALTADVAVLHRLTTVQIRNSVASLFGDDGLPSVVLPAEIPVGAFRNQALTRDATPFLVESLQRSLDAVAVAVVDSGWSGCDDRSAECGRDALASFLPRAWRRPVTDTEVAWIGDAYASWHAELGHEGAMRLALGVVLQSPDFLYLTEVGDPDTEVDGVRALTGFELAARLSYLIWSAPPDAELWGLAADGSLSEPEVLRAQAMRMVRDERSQEALLEFHRQWLGAGYATEVDPSYEALGSSLLFEEEQDLFEYVLEYGTLQQVIELDEYWGSVKTELRVSYQAEFDAFVLHTLYGPGSLSALLSSRAGWVSDRTAMLYGVEIPAGATQYAYRPSIGEQGSYGYDIDVYAVDLPESERAGILTQGAFLGGHSHPAQPSPVLRGVFVREHLLCVPPVSPPDDIPSLETATEGTSWTTNRERYAQHTTDPACAGCHTSIDGMGFPFEGYNAIGARRTTDNGAPVDTTGELVGTDVDGPVVDAVDLIEALAWSRDVHDCAVKQLWRYAMHRTETDADTSSIEALQDSFYNDGGILPNLIVRLATSRAFTTITLAESGGAR